jgi:hypothetical protein
MKMSSFFVFPCNGAPVEWNWQGKTEVLGEKPVPVPLHSPQIPHGLTRDRTRASAVGDRRLTAWAMAWPSCALHLQFSNCVPQRFYMWSGLPSLQADFGFQRCCFLGRGKTFFFIPKYPDWISAHLSSYSMGTGGQSPLLKQPDRQIEHLSSSCSDIKNDWSHTATSTYTLIECIRISFSYPPIFA